MNIVSAGSRFMVYGEDVKTYKILPPGAYKIEFSKMTGFSLSVHNDLLVKEKMYGNAYKKVYESYNICDFGWVTSWQEYWEICIRMWHRYGGEYPDKKQEYRYWLHHYRNK